MCVIEFYTMITRAHYHKLFNRIYLGSLILSTIICIIGEYHYNTVWRIPGLDDNLLLPVRPIDGLIVVVLGCLFVLPAFITWVIAGAVRLTNSLEPLTEEQRKLSFVERMSLTQLFLPLSLLLCGWMLLAANYYLFLPTLFVYLIAAAHFLFVWLVVIALRRIARLQKAMWKVTTVILLLFACLCYVLASGIVVSGKQEPGELYWERRYAVTEVCMEEDSDSENADFENMPQEELAHREVSRAFEIYDYYNGDSSLFTDIAGELLQYDPDKKYFSFIMTTPDMTQEQIDKELENHRRNFDNMQQFSMFIKWFLRSDDFHSIADYLQTAMLRMASRYNYADYAKMVDMLDMTYYDLDNNCTGEESAFWEVYDRASNQPLMWENYTDIITDPYIRYLAQRNHSADMDLVLWAYTFWGRRYNDDTYWRIQQLLNIVLEKHPNTHFPQEELQRQGQMFERAEKRVQEFLTWYRANYWAFRELKAAGYNDQGAIVNLDSEQYDKYLSALKKSRYLTPQLLKKLEDDFGRLYQNMPIVNNDTPATEWLRRDPLINSYNTIAGEIEDAGCRTDSIITPGESMYLTAAIDRLGVFVDCIDGEWFISGFDTK